VGSQLILTAAPEYEDAALTDLRRTLPPRSHMEADREGASRSRPRGTVRLAVAQRFGPGVLLIELPATFAAVSAALSQRATVFIRHIQPVQQEIPLAGDPGDLDRLAASAVRLTSGIDPTKPFSVQTRLAESRAPLSSEFAAYGRFEVNERLSSAIQEATGAVLDVRSPQQVVSVMIAPTIGYLGHSCVEQNLSSWAGGAMRFAREPDQVSRSEFKLLEALEVFHLTLPPTGAALDLGASPGGWTRLLRLAGLQVTAVDPGDLDPRVAADPGVHHVRATAQEYRCRPGEYRVIVNDMRMDARDSARLMLEYAPCLASDGMALITLKLPHRQPEQVVHQAISLLLRRYELRGARQLFHNRSEITVALQRRSADGGRTKGEAEPAAPGGERHTGS
jgi:23S rRNA (cytidine2498-2'-O)-methyltransferase